MYNIIFDRSAEKDLDYLPKNIVQRIMKVIVELGNDPRPPGVKKLNIPEEDLYRVRSGDYRIVYAISDKIEIVNIRRIRHRKEVYKNL